MDKKKPLFFLLITLTVTFSLMALFGGCGRKPENEAEVFINAYYEHMEQKNFSTAANAFYDNFAKNMPKNRLAEKLSEIDNRLGANKKIRLAGWTSRKQTGAGLEGTYYVFNYVNDYENETKVQETFIVREPQSGRLTIMSYNLNAVLFNKDPLAPDE